MNSMMNVDFPIRQPQNAQEMADLVFYIFCYFEFNCLFFSSQVQNTITQIQEKFEHMSDSILTKVDEMGRRIDELERNSAYIVSQANAELP